MNIYVLIFSALCAIFHLLTWLTRKNILSTVFTVINVAVCSLGLFMIPYSGGTKEDMLLLVLVCALFALLQCALPKKNGKGGDEE